MTQTDYTSNDSTGRPKNRNAHSGIFEWTCPHCGETRLNTSMDGSGEANAITALRVHIYASDGPEHGPRRQYPTGYDVRTLAEHVVEVDSRD